MQQRHSTGTSALDELLGGGLVPGTMTVVVGATGIGKTQLAVQYAAAGLDQERRRGVILDLSARGDSQSHSEYARRICDWQLASCRGDEQVVLHDFFDPNRSNGDYLHIFGYQGQRVTQRDLEFEQWRHWQAVLNARLRTAIAFLYGNFVQGCRRVVVDGVEPVDRQQESIQFELFEYLYHQVLRKDPQWVARDLFRETYRQHAELAERHAYPPDQIGCLLLCTSKEALLDDLIARGIEEGDALSNANTLIYMGKVREGSQVKRALYVAKHRGSACSDRIILYRLTEQGLAVEG